MYEVGKRIKATRESKGISQKDFAISIGAKSTTVANWEKGVILTYFHRFYRIIRCLIKLVPMLFCRVCSL